MATYKSKYTNAKYPLTSPVDAGYALRRHSVLVFVNAADDAVARPAVHTLQSENHTTLA